MKTCPNCNNMLDNNISICPYCGRNVIGITEYNYSLKNKGQVVNENLKNEGISKKIYGSNKGIRNINDDNLKASINKLYDIALKKNIAIFLSLSFIISLITKLSTYKLLFLYNTTLYIFLIPIVYSTFLFLAISLKSRVRIKLFIILLSTLIYIGIFGYYGNILQLNFLDSLFTPINMILITISFTISFLRYKQIKFLFLMGIFSYIIYEYYIYLKPLGIDTINIIFLVKKLLLFLMGIFLFLFLLYDFLFFNKK